MIGVGVKFGIGLFFK